MAMSLSLPCYLLMNSRQGIQSVLPGMSGATAGMPARAICAAVCALLASSRSDSCYRIIYIYIDI